MFFEAMAQLVFTTRLLQRPHQQASLLPSHYTARTPPPRGLRQCAIRPFMTMLLCNLRALDVSHNAQSHCWPLLFGYHISAMITTTIKSAIEAVLDRTSLSASCTESNARKALATNARRNRTSHALYTSLQLSPCHSFDICRFLCSTSLHSCIHGELLSSYFFAHIGSHQALWVMLMS